MPPAEAAGERSERGGVASRPKGALELGDASVFRGRVGGGLAGAPLKLGAASVLGGEFAAAAAVRAGSRQV